MKIYTKTGDKGETSLFGGTRVSKSDAQVDLYGSIDELNSWIGLTRSKIKDQKSKRLLEDIQNDLFVIGSTFAGWKGDLSSLTLRVSTFENEIDRMDKKLPELKNFILPGGSEVGAFLHVARTTTRRVERQLVGLSKISNSQVSISKQNMDAIIMYFNRLSDLFFQMARFINKQQKKKETIWVGIKRK